MDEEDLKYIICNHKWRLRWSDVWNRYILMLFPGFLLFLSVALPIGTGFAKSAIIFALFILPFGVYFFYEYNKSILAQRRFYVIDSKACQMPLIEKCIQELGWKILSSNEQYLQAKTKTLWSSWGEIITIVFLENQILFNSHPNMPTYIDRVYENFQALFDLLMAKEKQLQ